MNRRYKKGKTVHYTEYPVNQTQRFVLSFLLYELFHILKRNALLEPGNEIPCNKYRSNSCIDQELRI